MTLRTQVQDQLNVIYDQMELIEDHALSKAQEDIDLTDYMTVAELQDYDALLAKRDALWREADGQPPLPD